MNMPESWMIFLTTKDRAGSTAAIASVFSGRGIQIESFLGFGNNLQEDGSSRGKILIIFKAFPERVPVVCRVLESLQAVDSIECYSEKEAPEKIIQAANSLKAAIVKVKV